MSDASLRHVLHYYLNADVTEFFSSNEIRGFFYKELLQRSDQECHISKQPLDFHIRICLVFKYSVFVLVFG